MGDVPLGCCERSGCRHAGGCLVCVSGGGFGGCTINIIKKDAAEKFTTETTKAYQKKLKIVPEVYEILVVDGTNEIN